MSTGLELLLRSPLVAARPLPPHQAQWSGIDGATERERRLDAARQHWDASAALGVLAAAGAALRPHDCDPVVWRPQVRSMWQGPRDPARRIDTWLGHPATGTGVLWAAWHRHGQPLRWSDDPADNGPVRHFMAVHYTVNRTFAGDADAELARWCQAMGPQLTALDGWVRDPERGHCYPWQGPGGGPSCRVAAGDADIRPPVPGAG